MFIQDPDIFLLDSDPGVKKTTKPGIGSAPLPTVRYGYVIRTSFLISINNFKV
jgi:hypothetical protein